MGLLDKFKKNEEPFIEFLKLTQAKKFNEALEFHEKNFDKNNEGYWYTRGNLFSNLNRPKDSLECYFKATQLKDTYVKAWFRLGQRLFEFGRFKEAREAFVKASMIEQKTEQNEWNTIATFYYMMALYLEYQNTKDEKIKEKIPNEIRKLREAIEIDKNATDEDFLNYCDKNFQEILDKLEPKVVAEFRHPESIN